MGKVVGTSALKPNPDEKYRFTDWLNWPENERWELIAGRAYNMSPSPNVPHQDYVMKLANQLYSFLEGESCRLFVAPLDVFLEAEEAGDEGDTVVQPDLMVVCAGEKIKKNGIHGSPDFLVEVLSDSTANKDFSSKRDLYERSGVREYWLIQPDTGTVFQYLLKGDSFAPLIEHRRGAVVESPVISGFKWTCG